MKKICMWFAVLALGLVAFSTPAMTGEPGDLWTIGSYCIGDDPEFIRNFTDAIVRGGIDTYREFMNNPVVPCFDTRMHGNIKPVQVVLVENLWDFTLPGGEALTMWVIEDSNGRRGYTWIAPEGEVESDPA